MSAKNAEITAYAIEKMNSAEEIPNSRDHRQRLSLPAHFVVQFIARPDLQLSSIYEGLDRLAASLGKSHVGRIWSENNLGTSRADLCLFADSS
ncbi:MAG: hypothetical protein ABSD89_01265 [Halobacteriota archaeon]|jgi:hypothetical protein